MPQAIHFISIGGSAMHNLALALQQQGYIITGSDDEIYEPSRTRLAQHGLLPAEMGWFPAAIHAGLDAVIVGMHARKDNPELIEAQVLGLPIYSYPEYIYRQSQQKQRVVIAGSHGKTTITAMILHVLKYHNRTFDYLVGAQIDGFETMAKLSLNAPVIIIEGDEYGSSPIDTQPKFLHYQPHIALISGIAWDHVNIYPTWDQYVHQFELLAEGMPKAGILIFDETDDMLDIIGQKERADITKVPYEAHPNEIVDGKTYLLTKQKSRIPVLLFGEHNMKNIAGAMTVLDRIGITDTQFYEAIPTFKGAAGRLEKVASAGNRILFRDFAHAPSKVEATTEAVKRQYPGRKLLAAVELHTFSSLNRAFLDQYKGCLDAADEAIVYFDAHTFAVKRLEPITPDDVIAAFDRPKLRVFTDTRELQAYLVEQHNAADVFLLMSSGSFGGLELNVLAEKLVTGL
ncbi:UDP-N-acetylmuramate--L-alanine ligase [Spirosoma utsteinense]|uniref:UDP-N-acetylmuramate: L-alanyl-gamma-D-glutamyl-meso-diaminopimelate ligase n=1 Tax=Spirosoma utsteinense TaxID=2585773 RepID=A0ABR6W3Y5_9BACT|nr:Mur ligase family protein [Spirosoma utsteinense]MBC3788012.1 UDP-N-acetylmuramate: L-alanyl-gamma-D-glutamyl-meso-diaminopimelate ligase [Spirosoma utsteinense]MBC3791289.1 UDP-N-acetylmuramate: L-alanyl-gamma-D-glutamyl-meso-diaminopimelate ligase [Spirosoma utsteinense]